MAHIDELGPGRDGRPRLRVKYWTSAGQRSKNFAGKFARRRAESFARTVEVDKARGALVDPRTPRLKERWLEYVAAAEVRGKPSAATLAPWRWAWRTHVDGALGSRRIGEIRRSEIQDLVDDVAESAPGSAKHVLAVVRILLERAVRDEVIAANRALRIDLPRRPLERPRVVSERTFWSAVLPQVPDEHRAMVAAHAYGAFRWSEIIAIGPEHVDWLRRRILVERKIVEVDGELHMGEPKTRKSRRAVPLPATVMELLAEHVRRYPDAGGFVFHRAGRPLQGSNFRHRVWTPAVERAEVPWLTLKNLRHCGGSWAAARGASLKEIAELMGHESTAMADRHYVVVEEASVRGIADRFEAGIRELDEAAQRSVP